VDALQNRDLVWVFFLQSHSLVGFAAVNFALDLVYVVAQRLILDLVVDLDPAALDRLAFLEVGLALGPEFVHSLQT
jgi:hypothetical protein